MKIVTIQCVPIESFRVKISHLKEIKGVIRISRCIRMIGSAKYALKEANYKLKLRKIDSEESRLTHNTQRHSCKIPGEGLRLILKRGCKRKYG